MTRKSSVSRGRGGKPHTPGPARIRRARWATGARGPKITSAAAAPLNLSPPHRQPGNETSSSSIKGTGEFSEEEDNDVPPRELRLFFNGGCAFFGREPAAAEPLVTRTTTPGVEHSDAPPWASRAPVPDLPPALRGGAGTGADPRVVTFAEFSWVPPLLGPSPINTQDLATFATADSRTSLKLDVTPSGEAALIYVGGDGGLDFVTYGP